MCGKFDVVRQRDNPMRVQKVGFPKSEKTLLFGREKVKDPMALRRRAGRHSHREKRPAHAEVLARYLTPIAAR